MCLVTRDLRENIFVTSTVCSCRVTSCKEIGFKDRQRVEIFRVFSLWVFIHFVHFEDTVTRAEGEF